MKLPEDQFLSIVDNLSKYYGPDIAHDVAIAILKRRNPLRKPERWAVVYAAGLARRERQRAGKTRVFADLGIHNKHILSEHFGYGGGDLEFVHYSKY